MQQIHHKTSSQMRWVSVSGKMFACPALELRGRRLGGDTTKEKGVLSSMMAKYKLKKYKKKIRYRLQINSFKNTGT